MMMVRAENKCQIELDIKICQLNVSSYNMKCGADSTNKSTALTEVEEHANEDNSDTSNANSHIFDINTSSSISSLSQTGYHLNTMPFLPHSNEMVQNTPQFMTIHTQAPSLHDTSGFSLNTIASDYQCRPFMITTSSALHEFANNHNNNSNSVEIRY